MFGSVRALAVHPVILCGGSGTRLWPASRPGQPKQFIPLVGERSSFQTAVLRVAGLPDAAEPIVVAGVGHADWIAGQLEELGVAATVILEPEARDSAPAMAVAALWIAARDADGVALVVSADHHIPDAAAFQAAVALAAEAARSGLVVTLGVRPTAPATAYGYIRAGEGPDAVKPVARFVEKPDAATAAEHIAAGYLWNSGNFVVAAATLIAELEAHAPEVVAAARRALDGADRRSGALALGAAFREAPRVSIDYAVMEKTRAAAVLPVDFAWSDIGAWDAVWQAADKDANGNAGAAIFAGAEDILVRAPSDVTVAVVGLSGVGVVVEGRAVLVTALARSQEVKGVAEQVLGQPARHAAMADLAGAHTWYEHWLRTAALPVWWSLGADHARGGFHDALAQDGTPMATPRRMRVQARQTYVYAEAVRAGWDGPWATALAHGLAGMSRQFRRADGLYRLTVGEDGTPLDDTAMLYEQAFAVLALATALRCAARPELAESIAVVRRSLDDRRHAAGGFLESGSHPHQANAHMHLLEAALACEEAGVGGWTDVADEIAELALTRFIEGGVLREFFDAGWSALSGDAGLVEPGHQFEWAWLLERWGRARGRADARDTARALFATGRRGVDPRRGVAVNALWNDLSVRDASARLWPQTEHLKAALILGETEAALEAAGGLARYLETPTRGLWWDIMTPDGGFMAGPAPGSSFYHVVGAILELGRSRSDQ